MNNLIVFDEEFSIKLDPQIFTLKPFKAIHDKYKDKDLALAEVSYIVFLLHPKSDFSDERDLKVKKKTILESMHNGDKIKLDAKTNKAIEMFKERMNTPKTLLLDSALDTLDKMRMYLNTIDFSGREIEDRNGEIKIIQDYDPKKVIEVIEKLPKVMTAIKELEDQIRKEQETENSTRGSGQKGAYEDG